MSEFRNAAVGAVQAADLPRRQPHEYLRAAGVYALLDIADAIRAASEAYQRRTSLDALEAGKIRVGRRR